MSPKIIHNSQNHKTTHMFTKGRDTKKSVVQSYSVGSKNG